MMRAKTWGLWLSACLLAAGCEQATASSDDVQTGSSTDTVAVDTQGGADAVDDSSVDPGVCDPPCDPWMACKAGNCGDKTCTADSECNAASPEPGAVPYYCYKGICKGFQCAKDEDCGAKQGCNSFTYTCFDKSTGCTVTADCDDKDSCTLETCLPDGTCKHDPIFACCATLGDCEDGSDCTTDACTNGKCTWTPKGVCCTADKECNDGKPCTQDLCSGGVCLHPPAVNCCLNDGECTDGNDDSTDACKAGKCTHVWKGLATACPGGQGCTSNACAVGTCSDEFCSYSAPGKMLGCCSGDSQCAKNVACMVDLCEAQLCVSQKAVGSGTHVWNHFDDTSLNGWTVEQSSKTVYFHFGTLTKVAGAGCLRYGVPGQTSFEDQNPNKGAALSPVLTLPQAPTLDFWVLLDVSPGAAIHQAGIDAVDPQTGAVLANLWSKNKDLNTGTTGAKWLHQQLAMPATLGGKAVKLKIWFDEVKWDTSNKQKLGFLVDELTVGGACP